MRPRASDSNGSVLLVAESKQESQECGVGDIEHGNIEYDTLVAAQFCVELR
ncbi:MAG: hypothetical protein WCB99_13600 [Candidatus Cybelea sp.]